MYMHIKNKRGQSTVEYILLMTAVVAVIIGFVATQNGGFQGTLTNSLNDATGQMTTLSERLQNSEVGSNITGGGQNGYFVNAD
jgi:Flp pilus assembly pilin Flp